MEGIAEFFQSINPIAADGTTAAIGTFWAIVPPIVAIALALITKEVYISLFVGIVSGVLLYSAFNPLLAMENLFTIMGEKIGGNINICIFLVFLGIVVALVTKSGASRAYGNWASKAIATKRGALFATTGLGVLIFVDDYFNCLTVGTVMSPVTNRHGVSRSKLAYIIDATAAPVCIIAPISSWAAAVGTQLPPEGITVEGQVIDGFSLFIRTIPYNFYAILTIVMIVFIISANLDFGPMRKAEAQLDDAEDIEVADPVGKKKTKGKVIDLVLPIAVLIICCILAMLYTGGILDKTDKVGKTFTESAVTVVFPEKAGNVAVTTTANGQSSEETVPTEKVVNLQAVSLLEGTGVNKIDKNLIKDGILSEPVKVTLPAGAVVYNSDEIIKLNLEQIKNQYNQELSKEEFLQMQQMPQDFYQEGKTTSDLSITLPKGTKVSNYGVGTLIQTSFADCDSSLSLVMGSLITIFFIFLLYLPRKVLSYKEFAESIVDGFKAMVPAIAILTLAWTLSGVCRSEYLDSGTFVKGLVETYNIPFGILPAVFFLIALGLGFATGTSWGTFGILIPIILTVLGQAVDIKTLSIAIAAILAGAVCGDHISPISDTTILASTGARCNHIRHVQTQMPYALLVAAVCFVGYLIAGFVPGAYSGYIGLASGIVLLLVVLVILRIFNKPLPAYAGNVPAEKTETALDETASPEVMTESVPEETVVEETVTEETVVEETVTETAEEPASEEKDD